MATKTDDRAPAPDAQAGSPLWRFSLAFYRDRAVQQAFLTVQDDAGGDVNMLLYLLFAASRGNALAGGEVAELDRLVADWRARVVRPLRAVRRTLKDAAGSPPLLAVERREHLRARIKADELEAERLQQEAMFAFGHTLAATSVDRQKAARANFAAYERYLGTALPAAARDVLLAAFDDFHARRNS